MRFVSHLDMTRVMSRLIRRAKLPIWYTEGFNPHPYITFALPLSLGHESDYEVMDIRILDDNYDLSTIPEKLLAVSPEGLVFTDCFEAVKKAGAVGFSKYTVTFSDNGAICDSLKEYLNSRPLVLSKKTKRGNQKEIDVGENMHDLTFAKGSKTAFSVTLPAGGSLNIIPELLINGFYEKYGQEYYCYSIKRDLILDSDMNIFR